MSTRSEPEKREDSQPGRAAFRKINIRVATITVGCIQIDPGGGRSPAWSRIGPPGRPGWAHPHLRTAAEPWTAWLEPLDAVNRDHSCRRGVAEQARAPSGRCAARPGPEPQETRSQPLRKCSADWSKDPGVAEHS